MNGTRLADKKKFVKKRGRKRANKLEHVRKLVTVMKFVKKRSLARAMAPVTQPWRRSCAWRETRGGGCLSSLSLADRCSRFATAFVAHVSAVAEFPDVAPVGRALAA